MMEEEEDDDGVALSTHPISMHQSTSFNLILLLLLSLSSHHITYIFSPNII